MTTDEQYVCTLTEASLEKARKELCEDPKERIGAVNTFRTWILQQPHITCPTDTEWLLRFLRNAKFSQLRAREKLTYHLKCKTDFNTWFDDIDTTEKGIQAFLSTGYMVPLPGFDDEGRKILLIKEGAIDPHSKVYNVATVMRAIFAYVFHLLRDENVQVNGVVCLSDMTGFSIKHQTFWGYEGMKNSTKCFEGGIPCRFKGYYLYNAGPIVDTIMAMMKPFMSKKTLDRMRTLGENMENVYKYVPKRMLPDEYLPDDYKGPSAGSYQSLVEEMKSELIKPEVRARILAETKAEYKLDKSKEEENVPQASFRKLNVDG